MQPGVVAVECVRSECQVVDPDQVHDVFEMLHHELDAVFWILLGDRGVRCRFNPNHAALVRARLQHVVRLEPLGIPQPLRSHMRDEHRLAAQLEHVHAGLVARVRKVDRDPDLIHPVDALSSELGQPAVVVFFDPRAQRVQLAVSDPQHAHAQPVEHLDPVHLVLYRCAAFHAQEPGDLAHPA